MIKNITAFFLAMLIGVIGNTTTRTICLSGCDYTTINSAEAVSLSGDILEIRDNRTYNETWTPGGERTIRNQSGNTPTLNAVNLNSAGANAVTIIGLGDIDDFVITSASQTTVDYNGTNNLTLVIENMTIECTKNNNNTLNIAGSGAVTVTVKKSNILGTGKFCINMTNSNAASVFVLQNTYFHDAADCGVYFATAAGSTLNMDSCTIRNTVEGTFIGSGTYTCTNCLFQDNTDDINGTPANKAIWTYNLFEEQTDTGGWGTGNVFATSITFTGASTAIPTGWQMADDQANINVGATALTTDIVGTVRPQDTDDIGAYEYPAAISLPRGSFMMMGVGF